MLLPCSQDYIVKDGKHKKWLQQADWQAEAAQPTQGYVFLWLRSLGSGGTAPYLTPDMLKQIRPKNVKNLKPGRPFHAFSRRKGKEMNEAILEKKEVTFVYLTSLAQEGFKFPQAAKWKKGSKALAEHERWWKRCSKLVKAARSKRGQRLSRARVAPCP